MCYTQVMKIIISPAKQMKSNEDTYFPLTSPLYLEKAKKLVGHLSKLSYQQLKTVLNCSDSLAKKLLKTIRPSTLITIHQWQY